MRFVQAQFSVPEIFYTLFFMHRCFWTAQIKKVPGKGNFNSS